MGPAGFVVSSDEGLVGSLDEKNFEVHIFVSLQSRYAAFKVTEKPASSHVDYESRLFYILGTCQRKVYEIFYEGRGHVVYAVIALVLKPVRRLGFAGAGKSRYNYYFHYFSFILKLRCQSGFSAQLYSRFEPGQGRLQVLF